MTTLNGTINSTVDILRVSADNGAKDNGFKFRIDDEILAFLGYDRHDAAAILRVKAGDLTYWHVARAQDGTTAATHTSGATLYAVVEGFVTGSSLTPPDPFGYSPAPATPTLAEVLAEGADTGAHEITSAGLSIQTTATDGYGGAANIYGAQGDAGKDGGYLNLSAGNGNGGATTSAALTINGGQAAEHGRVLFVTSGEVGSAGQALVSDGAGLTVWGFPGAAELVITEDASGAAGTYTGSIVVPGGATITGMRVTAIDPFDDEFKGIVSIGDGDNAAGFLDNYQLGTLIDGANRLTVDVLSPDQGAKGAYLASLGTDGSIRHLYSATDYEVVVTLTSNAWTGTPPFIGAARVLITWAKPTPVAATFEAAP